MNEAGDIAEIAFIHEAYKRGYVAFIPYSHNTKVDVAIMRDDEDMITVQVKKGTLQKAPPHLTQSWKALVGSAKSATKRCNGKPRFTKYKPKAFDILALYVAERNEFVLYKLTDIVGKASIRWNDKHPSNNWEVIEDYYNE